MFVSEGRFLYIICNYFAGCFFEYMDGAGVSSFYTNAVIEFLELFEDC